MRSRDLPRRAPGAPWDIPCTRRSFLTVMAATTAAALLPGCDLGGAPRLGRRRRKAILLGFDGMDPGITRKLALAGRMPNAARLMQRGGFNAIGTSDPPQSPVAWSNVIAGANPGVHGIFDFIARDPATLQPYLSTSRIEGEIRSMPLGRWRLPLGGGRMRNLRRGGCFWNALREGGVPATVLRIPSNFPPVDSRAQTLSGLGTPDIHGAYGVFSFYTDRIGERSRDVSGGRIERVILRDHAFHSLLRGPENALDRRSERADIPFDVWRDPDRPAVRIRLQDADFLLRQGEWSDWVRVGFSMIPGLVTVRGICRVYLKRARDPFELYISPVNIDPADPSLPVSTPAQYAAEIERRLGSPYYTQGMAEDTSALSAGVFDDDEFRNQSTFVLEESLKMFDREFARFNDGLFFFYFSTLDQNQHAFWRAIDENHPLYTPDLAKRHGDFIPGLYEKMDQVLGRVLKESGPDDLVMAISDHGFGSFRRQFNLNSWLLDHGYAAPSGRDRGHGEYFSAIRWGDTRAYGLGINSLYLNQRGREPEGRVRPGVERRGLLRELAERLEQVTDPHDGRKVIRRVYRPEEIYSGPALDSAPDLVIGYNPDYRASWDTILGKYPREHVLDNRDPWSGDHCIDSAFMSGVVLANRPVTHPRPALTDVAPTLLKAFGVPKPPSMTGKDLFSERRNRDV